MVKMLSSFTLYILTNLYYTIYTCIYEIKSFLFLSIHKYVLALHIKNILYINIYYIIITIVMIAITTHCYFLLIKSISFTCGLSIIIIMS